MSRFLRNAALAALTVAAAGAVASAASAQSYGRLVVFGDSLSDNGNLYAATFNTQPTSPPYFQGRFSNGAVFTELLGFNAGRSAAGASVTGSINYAYGGARTDSSAFPPGMRNQLLAYTGAGGTFGANDLVSILGGANNIFQGLPAAGASPNPTGAIAPVISAAAADMTFLVNSIAAAGAGTILVGNIPSLGNAPAFRGTPAAPLAEFAGTSFNSALLAGLMTTAAARPGTNIILFDVYKVGAALTANPGGFGLTNVTDACFNGFTVCATPNTYLFWDGVHPTAAGHQLIARLANDYLYYGDIGAQSTVQAETGFRQREDLLDLASEGMSGRDAWQAGTQLTFGAIADSVETDARGSVAASDTTGWGGRVGLDHVMSPNARFGLAGTYRTAEVEAGAMTFDVKTYAFDVYGGWRSGGHFINATVGGSVDHYDDIVRLTSLAPIVHTGETRGGSIGGRLQGGMWFDMGGIALSPRVAVNYVSTEVNGYIEQGPAAQYAYEDRTVQAASGEVSLRAEGGGDDMSFFVEGGYRDNFGDSSDAVRTGITANPAQILARDIEDPFGGSLIASAGVEADLGPVRMTLGYRGRFGDSANSHVGALTFRLPLQ
ncbi:MAG: autotransporter domain-containing protein [Alphaproteobacteria bacterium]|jgi:outer membrane lipase/esterase|nr:autotransporter domain-containing protein [Alphaproteobacteria bacterium]MBU2041966.1 autotransporter domain-containing protein [Alphaproteobacteria bacterium]MBU2125120.1 autotransporter domain-containing protein [Alphaproteobacteria bacterium]MBU2207531.1 autotransporter domain-containing protein [Alphaproteobacteria bacterium]MBU2291276.1 autotransporter domain-containing protein [Alphaproteobacteria bacterium]